MAYGRRQTAKMTHNVNICAGDDISVTASTILAANDALLHAVRGDVTLNAAQDESFMSFKSRNSQAGLFPTQEGINFYQGSGTKASLFTSSNVGSAVVAGNDLLVVAGRDVNSIGSLLAAGNDVILDAGRDVNLLPGYNAAQFSHVRDKLSAGISFSISEDGISRRMGFNYLADGTSQFTGTNMGSLVTAGNDVLISAGRDVNQVASHIVAGRDVAVVAERDWNMLAGLDAEISSSWSKQMQAGVTESLKQNVSRAVRAIGNISVAAGDAKGGAGFTGISAAGAGLEAASAVYSAIMQVVSASVDIGFSQSQQKSSSEQYTASPSSIFAGRDIDAFAGRDIYIEGGRLVAMRDITLDAGRDLTITAARNFWRQSSSSSSMSVNAGVSVGFGATGWSVSGYVGGSAGGSQSSGDGISYTNALVVAGGTLSTKSGNDTNIRGANLLADRIKMNVGNNLNVASLQDTSSSKGSSWGIGGGIALDLSGLTNGWLLNIPVTPGADSANINLSYGQAFSDGRWVGNQTSIIGKSEVDIFVGNHTDLRGAVIGADNGNLVLNTNTLSYSNLYDYQRGQNWNAGIGLSFGKGKEDIKINDVTFSGRYNAYNMEQINRATVGQGTIIVRSEPGAALAGLNRALWRSQEITKNDQQSGSIYVSTAVLRELFQGAKNVAEEYNRWANLLPGAGQNDSITGQNPYKLDANGEYITDRYGNREPDVGYGKFWSGTSNPLFQFLYHVIPGVKSASEIHDAQTDRLAELYKNAGREMPGWLSAATIIPSFMQTYLHAAGTTLNVPNWGSSWDNYIKRSFDVRPTVPQQ